MKVTTEPRARVLLGMRNRRWTASGAISELIDNSFGAGRGNAINVAISWNTNRKVLTVIDDGEGMDDISRAFRLGDTIGTADNDIGYYGMGGSEAMLWLADRVAVHTLRAGRVSSATVDWRQAIESDEFPTIDTAWTAATALNTPAELLALGQGTMIRLHVSSTRRLRTDNIQRDLARTYAAGLRKGRRISWTSSGRGTSGETIELQPWQPPAFDEAREFEVELEQDGQLLRADVHVGYADGLAAKDSRMSITYGHREVETTTDCYGEHAAVGVCGWIDLHPDWRSLLSTEKDGIDHGPARDLLMQAVYEQISELLDLVDEYQQDLVIEGVALTLESMFDGVFTVETPARLKERDEDPEPRSETVKRQSPTEDPAAVDDPGEDVEEAHAKSKIHIEPTNDEALGGLLAWADIRRTADATSVHVLLNKDHTSTEAAMVRQPVNHMLLISYVAHAIGAKILETRDPLLEQVLPGGLAALEDVKPDAQAGTIVRALVDRVQVPR